MGPRPTGQRLHVLEVAAEVLGRFDDRDTIGVSELADEMDIPKSTAHIYLKSLFECRFLTKKRDRYALSLRFLERGALVRSTYEIYDAAKSEVDRLASATGEAANLGVEEGGHRVLLYKRDGSDALNDNSLTGEFTCMHWTSLGKVLLAHLPRDRVDEIVDEHGLPAATCHTITDRDELIEELGVIRERGYSLEDEEHWESIRAIAVPIVNDGDVHGALSLSGPKARFSDARMQHEFMDELTQSKNVVEIQLRHY